jgi:hypothetical protein
MYNLYFVLPNLFLTIFAKLIRSCTCAAPVHRSEHKKTPTISRQRGFKLEKSKFIVLHHFH